MLNCDFNKVALHFDMDVLLQISCIVSEQLWRATSEFYQLRNNSNVIVNFLLLGYTCKTIVNKLHLREPMTAENFC